MSTAFGGQWTEEKLDILRGYLDAYTTVLKKQPFSLVYLDAFAGEGLWSPGAGYSSEEYGDFIEVHEGSPLIALGVRDRQFDRLVFVEKDGKRAESLRSRVNEYPNRVVKVVEDDANDAIPRFCDELGEYERAVAFLDPFATEVSWDAVTRIAETERIDCWVLFPRGAIARMMPRRDEPTPALMDRLDHIFGGREHWEGLYRPSAQLSLFDDGPRRERPGSQVIADRYKERLESVFTRVAPTRRTLTNSKNSPMFELFFGAGNPVGADTAIRIADHLLSRW